MYIEKEIHDYKKGFIGTIDQYREDMRDNEYLLTGYRCHYDTWRGIWSTLFMCHNETVNVWSHLLGCIGFVVAIMFVAFGINNMSKDGQIMFK